MLVTGGTGSFGHAFVRRALADGARRIVVFSRDELKQSAMKAEFQDDRLRYFIGDVRNYDRLLQAMREVEIVVHAAAMKRVEVCEENPEEAFAVNSDGSANVARACIAAGVEKALMLSTDKACDPATVYGASKQSGEFRWRGYNVYAAGTPTRLSATRYGNVWGSRGSVAHTFREQAAKGEVTLTDRRMSRFWMSLDESVDLVLLALREMRGGEIFVPKVPASTVAMIAGRVAPGVPYREIGIRGREKLYESLISEHEARHTYEFPDHYRIEPIRTWETLPALNAKRVGDYFEYRSDTARCLTAAELDAMVAA